MKNMNACMIGKPVGHSSLSRIIRLVAEKYNLDINFIQCTVRNKECLKDAILGIKALNFTGFDVTHPYKKEIIKYLDFIDPKAKVIGSVDTVIIKDDKLYGYNHNSFGAITSIEEEGRKIIQSDKVVVIGAGGCASSVCFEVYKRTKKLVIINRFLDEADDLKKNLVSFGGKGVRICALNEENLKKELVDAQFILHTTPVGMHPFPNETLVNEEIFDHMLKKKESITKVICWDSIYAPPQTLFLKYAQERGAKTINGYGMVKKELPLLIESFYGERINLEDIKEDLNKLILES